MTKQERIEKAAEEYSDSQLGYGPDLENAFKAGVQWEKERSMVLLEALERIKCNGARHDSEIAREAIAQYEAGEGK